MKTNNFVSFGLLAFVGLLLVVGCASETRNQLSLVADTNSPPADLQDARFTGPGDPNTRNVIVAEGSYFKSSGEPRVADFQSRLPNHPVANQRRWRSAKKIILRSGIEYRAKTVHSSAYDLVEVRVKGEDGNWSNVREVRK